MEIITIDIETKSDKDIMKSGVYAYADSKYFDILLFSYSIDGGQVQVVDLANGEKIPDYILKALTDETIIKQAFNVNFERVCLSVYVKQNYPQYFKGYGSDEDTVGNYFNPAGWHCTMIHSRYLSLPSSLADVGRVLKIQEQKMTEGKALIKFFCVPHKTEEDIPEFHNPSLYPDKWETFKAYNKRDVEAEMEIDRRLEKYPVPDFVWEEFYIDQKINDRGIRIDLQLAQNAIALDEHIKAELSAEMCRLTGVENPNSVYQLLKWLEEQGYSSASLGKEEVAELLKTAEEPVRSVLALRQQLAKSSVKKYTAMTNMVCSDDRARGTFSFYGASRTGRWCLTGDHEVLTPNGWVRLDEWNGGRIACWNNKSESVSFQKAEQVHFDYDGSMYLYKDGRIDQYSTPDHKMWVQKRYGDEWRAMTVEEMASVRPCIPITGYRYHRGCANPAWLRVLIMTQADGHYVEDGGIRFRFKKQRKIERCKHLLRKAEIMFTTHQYSDAVVISIPAREVPLWLREFRTKTFGFWLLDENPDIFFDELPNWDGYCPAPNSIQYSTCNKQNADIVQALAHMSGRTANVRMKHHHALKSNWQDAYVVDIWLTPKNCHEIKVKPVVEQFSGKVYCAVTQTGYFLVRRNGKVWITGNSGRNIQLQNLPQNHIPDLAGTREIIRSGDFELAEMLYDNIPDILSQLIRTALVPRDGYKFIVADFSSVEARILAWLAGETWRMQAFARGDDIYCASASKMFGVPVVKHGINGHLRQKGKVAELACGYGGSIGAMKAMGGSAMGLSDKELKQIVTDWRAASPNIVKLWYAVDDAAMTAVVQKTTTQTHGIKFIYQNGILFVELSSKRRLAYIRPQIDVNRFGGDSLTYEGVGTTKKWERLETYGSKIVENIVQGIARDLLCHSMKTLSHCFIVAHVHDELIIEADKRMSVEAVCKQMAEIPDWAEGLILRADGFECEFYQKD